LQREKLKTGAMGLSLCHEDGPSFPTAHDDRTGMRPWAKGDNLGWFAVKNGKKTKKRKNGPALSGVTGGWVGTGWFLMGNFVGRGGREWLNPDHGLTGANWKRKGDTKNLHQNVAPASGFLKNKGGRGCNKTTPQKPPCQSKKTFHKKRSYGEVPHRHQKSKKGPLIRDLFTRKIKEQKREETTKKCGETGERHAKNQLKETGSTLLGRCQQKGNLMDETNKGNDDRGGRKGRQEPSKCSEGNWGTISRAKNGGRKRKGE